MVQNLKWRNEAAEGDYVTNLMMLQENKLGHASPLLHSSSRSNTPAKPKTGGEVKWRWHGLKNFPWRMYVVTQYYISTHCPPWEQLIPHLCLCLTHFLNTLNVGHDDRPGDPTLYCLYSREKAGKCEWERVHVHVCRMKSLKLISKLGTRRKIFNSLSLTEWFEQHYH